MRLPGPVGLRQGAERVSRGWVATMAIVVVLFWHFSVNRIWTYRGL
jgi:hypothetical protein